METLASILAGQGANPYQQASQGIAPMLSQYLLNNQLAQGQLGQGQSQVAPQQPAPGMVPQGAPLGLGGMQGNPQAAALLQAIQSGQNPGQ
jgi:hypothetical protein